MSRTKRWRDIYKGEKMSESLRERKSAGERTEFREKIDTKEK